MDTGRLGLDQRLALGQRPLLYQVQAILQMSTVALKEFLRNKMESNPLLEVRWPDEEAGWMLAGRTEGTTRDDDRNREAVLSPWASVDFWTMGTDLRVQLAGMRLSPRIRTIAEWLIGELDDAGYLESAPSDLATRLNVPVALVEEALRALQACEPRGIGARDVRECLLLQLDSTDPLDNHVRRLIQVHWTDLARLSPDTVSRWLHVDQDTAERIIRRLRSLDPKPGRAFEPPLRLSVVPDVIFRQNEAGQWTATVNPWVMPDLRIVAAPEYVPPESWDDETKSFLRLCRQEALWLRRAVEQRWRTLTQVAQVLADIQRPFLDGTSDPIPLTAQHVAAVVGCHPSTVSRAVSGKYFQKTSRVYPLQSLLPRPVAHRGATKPWSAETVKKRIQHLIEKATCAPTDAAIRDALAAEGIVVARRTVAKYRAELGIEAARRRKCRNRHIPS
ncbi:MAG: RNA polymerase factor sigma-54 [Actinomycetia bacterium]|nr:RNA polymerase factor sigma-54 [Actinomycetes bacterium]